uniref:Uncharacterized protein n=1 Tax=Arundo donax TaxID=35708 RepID=A0A0A9CEA2_ARUDO
MHHCIWSLVVVCIVLTPVEELCWVHMVQSLQFIPLFVTMF